MGDSLSKALRERVAAAARQCCGYCLTDQRVSGAQMHVEHIVPRARGGSSQESNLWLACAWCNSYKGIQVEAQDPETGLLIPLFNPRRQRWIEHFAWDKDATHILGTKIGTFSVLWLPDSMA